MRTSRAPPVLYAFNFVMGRVDNRNSNSQVAIILGDGRR